MLGGGRDWGRETLGGPVVASAAGPALGSSLPRIKGWRELGLGISRPSSQLALAKPQSFGFWDSSVP